jgi:hypothetical protein
MPRILTREVARRPGAAEDEWVDALLEEEHCARTIRVTRISGRKGLEVGRYQFRVHVVHETFPAQSSLRFFVRQLFFVNK